MDLAEFFPYQPRIIGIGSHAHQSANTNMLEFGQGFNAMFVVDGEPQQHLTKRIIPVVKQRGLLRLAKEVRGALKAL